MQWSYIDPDNKKAAIVDVPVDVILSVPMFLRAYLLCRFMVLHSKQFQVNFLVISLISVFPSSSFSLYVTYCNLRTCSILQVLMSLSIPLFFDP